jgi:hypothetical protein
MSSFQVSHKWSGDQQAYFSSLLSPISRGSSTLTLYQETHYLRTMNVALCDDLEDGKILDF